MSYEHWLPLHCLHCMSYVGHEEWRLAPCPEECDCDSTNHTGTYVCPTCGNESMAIPPDEWDATILLSTERPLSMPPLEITLDDMHTNKYRGPAWAERLRTRQRWLGYEAEA